MDVTVKNKTLNWVTLCWSSSAFLPAGSRTGKQIFTTIFVLVDLNYFKCTSAAVKWPCQMYWFLPLHPKLLPLSIGLSAQFWRWLWALSVSFTPKSVIRALNLPLVSAWQNLQHSRKGIAQDLHPSGGTGRGTDASSRGPGMSYRRCTNHHMITALGLLETVQR